MKKFLKNTVTVSLLLIITIFTIFGSLSGTFNDTTVFYDFMKESSKLNVSVAFGLGTLVLSCLIFQNKTDLKVNKEKYSDYFALMFYFIVLNLGVFYLSYFPNNMSYKAVLIIYFILTVLSFVFLLFVTTKILGIIFNKKFFS